MEQYIYSAKRFKAGAEFTFRATHPFCNRSDFAAIASKESDNSVGFPQFMRTKHYGFSAVTGHS
jgi:hypothetical protein